MTHDDIHVLKTEIKDDVMCQVMQLLIASEQRVTSRFSDDVYSLMDRICDIELLLKSMVNQVNASDSRRVEMLVEDMKQLLSVSIKNVNESMVEMDESLNRMRENNKDAIDNIDDKINARLGARRRKLYIN